MTDATGQIRLRAGAATDTGRVRTVNQDRHALLPDRGLWIVADGMGGAQGGEVAAGMAIEALSEAYVEPGTMALLDAVAVANRRIHAAAENPTLRGMGTTAVALAIVPEEPDPDAPDDAAALREHLLVVNVGDSRAYLFRDGGLTQLTEDHSVVAELVRDGRLTQAQADVHPQRNIVTRVLGPYPEIQADLWPIDSVRGDRVILCSDGLFNEVPEVRIAAVLRRLDDPGEAAAELVRLANEGGGRDNITVIVLDVVDDGGVAEAASAALTGDRSRLDSADLAGFASAMSDEELAAPKPPKLSRRERRAARKAKRARRSRVTWRVVLFTILLFGVVGGALATVQWYGTSTYFVAFDGDEVAIFRGRPGGLLWIDPTLEDDTGIHRREVPAPYLADLEEGREQSSLAKARRYVSNIERDIAEATEDERTTTTTTTTTRPGATTTTSRG